MTYPRRPMPGRPSASMLHELRMIAQTFIRHRTTQSMFTPSPQPQQLATPPMVCVTCFKNGRKRDAIAVNGGRTVCMQHI